MPGKRRDSKTEFCKQGRAKEKTEDMLIKTLICGIWACHIMHTLHMNQPKWNLIELWAANRR